MTKKYFGTDGIRARVNSDKMNPELALKVGLAAGNILNRGDHIHRVVIGKDTRRSGYVIEMALASGFAAAGMDVMLVGPMPTPAVAKLVTSLRADAGVMISASHNPHYDNGLKFFGHDGYKISDQVETEIEYLLKTDISNLYVEPDKLGKIKRIEDVKGRYIEFAKSTLSTNMTFEGLTIVLDCANGAAHRVAPETLKELGAKVIPIGIEPNGFNINKSCGSTHPETMSNLVIENNADIGIALDGDADRIIICDEGGKIIDGDQLIATIAATWKENNQLNDNSVVATVMSNMGLENYLSSINCKLIRTDVGDRHVIKEMRKHGYNVGGEQSGHIILSDYANTGDGLISGLQILSEIVKSGKKTSEVCNRFKPYPQILKNVGYENSDPLELDIVQNAIRQGKQELASSGRILIRKSGTEPLIRVMAEGKDLALVETIVDKICATIQKNI